MTTIGCHDPIPDALACRLVAHYFREESIAGPMAMFYWTGQVLPGAASKVKWLRVAIATRDYRDQDSRGRLDPQAVDAELRALDWYFWRHAGQAAQALWREQLQTHYAIEQSQLVVPWCWRAPETDNNPQPPQANPLVES